ncbi:MAG: cytochrome c [Planctomycetota bacterium]|nr:MAG: cytochrome c [Planctomycetota bacterium]
MWVGWCVAAVIGCAPSPGAFPPNRIFAKRLELTDDIDLGKGLAESQVLLAELFGTPDQPRWPAMVSELTPGRSGDAAASRRGDTSSPEPLVRLENLRRAAGAVRSDEQGVHWGLYRANCVQCHGVAGDGLGPAAALLNPYPRDFRMGKFKWKRTPLGRRPTRDDLRRVLLRGVPGTAMPSFANLDADDIEALVDYTIYLSIRGEFERRLLSLAAQEVDWQGGEHLYDPAWLPSEGMAAQAWPAQWRDLMEELANIVAQWQAAEELPIDVPHPDFPLVERTPSDDAGQLSETGGIEQQIIASIAHGGELFRGTVASCSFCHGDDATGTGQQNNYDEWTRDWTVLAGLNPGDTEALRPMLELGALKPRPILPRNLTWGIFRGGDTPEDLYLRIAHGVEGTPMPAAPLQPGNPQGLRQEEVWDLIRFLLSLSDRPADPRPGSPGGGT